MRNKLIITEKYFFLKKNNKTYLEIFLQIK